MDRGPLFFSQAEPVELLCGKGELEKLIRVLSVDTWPAGVVLFHDATHMRPVSYISLSAYHHHFNCSKCLKMRFNIHKFEILIYLSNVIDR